MEDKEEQEEDTVGVGRYASGFTDGFNSGFVNEVGRGELLEDHGEEQEDMVVVVRELRQPCDDFWNWCFRVRELVKLTQTLKNAVSFPNALRLRGWRSSKGVEITKLWVSGKWW